MRESEAMAMYHMDLFHRFAGHTGFHTMPRGLLAISAMAVVLEIAWRIWGPRKSYDIKAAGGTLGVAALGIGFGLVTSLVLGVIFAIAWSLAPVHWPLNDWKTWVVGFFAVELAYYWFHRLSHRVRWMWATHAVHHTPEQMTFLSAIRLGWTNLLSGGWIVYLPLVLLGFDPRLIFGLLAFDLRYQFFLHTEAVGKLGPLEWILNTPSHHRVHHGSNAAYLDRNYGGVVIFYDRLFGTFAEEKADDPVRYGLVQPLGTLNPFVLALGSWGRLLRDMRRAPNFGASLKVALSAP